MAKNAPSKTSPAASAPASTPPAADNASAETTPPAANTEALKARLDAAEAELDARADADPEAEIRSNDKRPTPEQIAKEMLANPEDVALIRAALALADANAAAKGAPVAARDEDLVRVYHLNRSKGSFIHGEYRLDPGANAVVPKWIADLWIGHADSTGKAQVGLQEGDPIRPDPEKVKLAAENEGLSAQIKALETQLAAAQAAGKAKQ